MLETLKKALGPQIKLATQLAADLPVTSIDVAGLENALLNLATNARDAMPGGGNLMFRTASVKLDESHTPVRAGEIPTGDYVQICVTDTGQGMSREIAERIFEPFFTTKQRGKGAGLGLSLVDGFVRQSRGDIRVQSEEGRGTTITLYFPIID
jgi:signal transduction histidine kinase